MSLSQVTIKYVTWLSILFHVDTHARARNRARTRMILLLFIINLL
nr:MAG TPA_asm: hypothetical protein [Microviridae sp.]